MATTVVTGKSATFTFDGTEGTAQVTTFTVDESRTTDTIETLDGTAVTGASRERAVSVDFLFDGDQAASFYATCKASYEGESGGTLSVDVNGAGWTGEGIVEAISNPVPADGAVTCTVGFKLSSWVYTAPVAY